MTSAIGSDLDVAVIGMACRFPGADGVEAFWQNLREGVESVTFFSDEELMKAGVSRAVLDDPAYVRAGAVLSDVETFDARFFGYTAREAQVLDPQHRLFLETSWEALERAGYDPERYQGSIGVFGGVSGGSWAMLLMSDPRLRAAVSPYQMMLSTEKDYLALRIAYKLDLRGPAVVIQTACSTSLVAVHMACQSLLAGECDMALAGGVSILVPQATGHVHQPGGILSADGHCRAFDLRASGMVRGSGAGLVVLKRLADALRDHDQVEAVVRGSAINNDGARKVGFTAPGVLGQASVIRAAQAIAGLKPEDITYVEAHGTATALGDPIEIAALAEAFRTGAESRGSCAIGSVKTNIGHLDAAAGVAGLIKTVLMLKHRELVPSLHFERPNPRIDFASSPFVVATRHAPWTSDRPRRAGVSSFGIGGTNAHVVLEEPPPLARVDGPSRPQILVMSARSEAALDRATDALALHLRRHPDLRPADVAFTLRAGRRGFDQRRAVVCRDVAEGARLLEARDPQRVWSGRAEGGRSVAFLFSGQGSQHVNMGLGLYEAEPVFRAEVDECCARLRPLLGLDLRRMLYPTAEGTSAAAEQLNETRFTQPALFVVEHALARLWMSWGLVPVAMIGHSVGEYVAACVAGVWERDLALALVAERARLMHECPRGAMTAVQLSVEAVRPLLGEHLDLCVMNGPEACVVGGPIDAIREIEERLASGGVAFGRVPTSHAFHSALMEPALAGFADRLAQTKLHPPRIPFVSNLTGTWITPEQATEPAYWVRHLRETVRFSEGLACVLDRPGQVALEVGPGQTLTALARRRAAAGPSLVLASMRHPRQDETDEEVLLRAAARLWCVGAPVDWSARDRREGPWRVTLPTYPFERERYWIGPGSLPEPGRLPADASPVANAKLPLDRWLHVPTWKRAEPASQTAGARGSFCVLADDRGIAEGLVEILGSAGARVTIVRPGSEFAWTGSGETMLTPGRPEDYELLLDELQARGGVPEHFLHLWGVGGADDSIDRGLLSVLFLGQALGRRQNSLTSLMVVTSAVQEVLGDETLSPRAATVLGPCRVIPQEYPLVSCRTFDLPGLDSLPLPASLRRAFAEAILAEVSSCSVEPTVALRGRYRWLPSYEPVAPVPVETGSAEGPPGLRPRGVYLVTGGLGHVGLALAEYLARVAQARLVLTGREGLPDPDNWDEHLERSAAGDLVAARIRAVRKLQGLGAEVLVLGADVADFEAMRRVLEVTRERFGTLHGVIHAAGHLGPGTFRGLDRIDREDCERQLRPKLRGAEVLATLLDEELLDFVLLTSSVSTVLGGLGMGAYAAANHALDAFARRQHQAGKKAWISVGWDGWRFDTASTENRLSQVAILPKEGGEVFARLLALGPHPQVIVSTTALEGRLAEWTRQRTSAPGEPFAAAEGDRHLRPEISAVYVPPEDPIERRVSALWAELLGIDRVGLDDNFFELGGSSLLAVHLMGRIKKEYPVELSVPSLFEAPSVRALSAIIRSQGPDSGLARSLDRGQRRKGSRQRLRRTSDEAVE